MNAQSEIARDRTLSALVGVLAICLLAYLPGLNGGFQFDDFYNIVNNHMLRALGAPEQSWLAAALSSDAGVLRRPLSMLSFGVNVAWFGMNPIAFKLVNLCIHFANGILLYAIGRRIAARLIAPGVASRFTPNALALLAAALWLLHPLNVSDVVYIVQRMNELAALFTLCGLLGYVAARERVLRGEPALIPAFASLCLFGVLAVFSKENGALIVAYALAIESTCYRFDAPQPGVGRAIKNFFLLGVGLPLVLLAIYLIVYPHWLIDGYAARDFTLPQRLLSEPRILCAYLFWIFVPDPASMGIYHDDFIVSTGLFSPVSTAVAIAFLLGLIAAAWRWRRRCPALAFAVSWFLVGHSLESSLLPLELVFEHRNYLPMAGLLLGTVCALAPLVPARWPARATGVVCAVLLLGLAAITAVRAASWGDPLTLALDDAHHHPDSARAQYAAGRALIVAGAMQHQRERAEQDAVPYFTRAAALDKSQLHSLTELALIRARHEPVPKSDLDDLAARLRSTPSYTQADAFLEMLIVASEEDLKLTPDDIAALVDAALDNPRFPPKVRAMILNNYGSYHFNIMHDVQGAVSLTLAAAAADPQNAYFPLNLTKIALAVKQPAKAKEYLDAARQLDKVGIYEKEIGALQQQIAQ